MKTITSVLAPPVLISTSLISGCGIGQASVADAEALEAATPVPVEVTQPYRIDIYAT